MFTVGKKLENLRITFKQSKALPSTQKYKDDSQHVIIRSTNLRHGQGFDFSEFSHLVTFALRWGYTQVASTECS